MVLSVKADSNSNEQTASDCGVLSPAIVTSRIPVIASFVKLVHFRAGARAQFSADGKHAAIATPQKVVVFGGGKWQSIFENKYANEPVANVIVSADGGPQFIARDFKEFIRISGMTHVRTSPFYPQSNGKIERWHKSLKRECIRPLTPLTLEDARRLIQIYVDHYNWVRLHSAIGYLTPQDRLAGRQAEIHAARDRKLEWARSQRQLRRQQATSSRVARLCHPATMTSPSETEAGSAGTQHAEG